MYRNIYRWGRAVSGWLKLLIPLVESDAVENNTTVRKYRAIKMKEKKKKKKKKKQRSEYAVRIS